MFLHVKRLLESQKEALDALCKGQVQERVASLSLCKAEGQVAQRRNMLGDYQDNPLLRLEEAVREDRAIYKEVQQKNAGLLDFYRTTSFALTGHTAATRPIIAAEYPLQARFQCELQSSLACECS